MVEEGRMIYPDEDELKEMFGEATFRVYIKNTECEKNEPVSKRQNITLLRQKRAVFIKF